MEISIQQPYQRGFFWIFPYNYPSSIYFLILSYVSTNIKDYSKNYFQIITTFEYNYFYDIRYVCNIIYYPIIL